MVRSAALRDDECEKRARTDMSVRNDSTGVESSESEHVSLDEMYDLDDSDDSAATLAVNLPRHHRDTSDDTVRVCVVGRP